MTRITGAMVLGVAMLMGYGLSLPAAQAAYVVTLKEVPDNAASLGSDVVANGSGSLDISSLRSPSTSTQSSQISSFFRRAVFGPLSASATGYLGVPSLPDFGFGSFLTTPTVGSGDIVGMFSAQVFVPADYMTGDPLLSSSTYNNASFASLGVTPGTYVSTWGSGANADSFTLQIVVPTAAVPEPSSALLIGVLLAGLLLVHALRRSPDAE